MSPPWSHGTLSASPHLPGVTCPRSQSQEAAELGAGRSLALTTGCSSARTVSGDLTMRAGAWTRARGLASGREVERHSEVLGLTRRLCAGPWTRQRRDRSRPQTHAVPGEMRNKLRQKVRTLHTSQQTGSVRQLLRGGLFPGLHKDETALTGGAQSEGTGPVGTPFPQARKGPGCPLDLEEPTEKTATWPGAGLRGGEPTWFSSTGVSEEPGVNRCSQV